MEKLFIVRNTRGETSDMWGSYAIAADVDKLNYFKKSNSTSWLGPDMKNEEIWVPECNGLDYLVGDIKNSCSEVMLIASLNYLKNYYKIEIFAKL